MSLQGVVEKCVIIKSVIYINKTVMKPALYVFPVKNRCKLSNGQEFNLSCAVSRHFWYHRLSANLKKLLRVCFGAFNAFLQAVRVYRTITQGFSKKLVRPGSDLGQRHLSAKILLLIDIEHSAASNYNFTIIIIIRDSFYLSVIQNAAF